jgi:hypothetical protein
MRKTVLAVLVAGFMALMTASALATPVDQVNGTGQTPLSAALGFNAGADLSGELNYNADPNGQFAGFSAHCDGYTSFKHAKSKDGYPRILVTATCLDKDGVTVYLKGNFVDRGEPGVADSVCIIWSYTTPNPSEENGAYIHDMGTISNGNIQIHHH